MTGSWNRTFGICAVGYFDAIRTSFRNTHKPNDREDSERGRNNTRLYVEIETGLHPPPTNPPVGPAGGASDVKKQGRNVFYMHMSDPKSSASEEVAHRPPPTVQYGGEPVVDSDSGSNRPEHSAIFGKKENGRSDESCFGDSLLGFGISTHLDTVISPRGEVG